MIIGPRVGISRLLLFITAGKNIESAIQTRLLKNESDDLDHHVT